MCGGEAFLLHTVLTSTHSTSSNDPSSSMRQAAVFFITILVIVNMAMAVTPVRPNGIYRLYIGNFVAPQTHRFVTAEPDARQGRVRIRRHSESKYQEWRLRNVGNGQVTLESRGAKRKYLSAGRSGALPGAHLGVTPTKQKWFISQEAGGPFTSYKLTYPCPVFNKTLVVSYSSNSGEPWYVVFANENPKVLQAFKFSRVE
ncbi:MAG: hypothetical protein J3R72DRAFT_124444 [Linnemannia gamsii]|nr:MAG: hypothetical protein J3R72DRAFT_124444 [Linnemannia gamsii]